MENCPKKPENLRKEVIDDDEILNFVYELKILIKEDKSVKELKKDCLDEIEKIEEALYNCIYEKDLNFFKNRIPLLYGNLWEKNWNILMNSLIVLIN